MNSPQIASPHEKEAPHTSREASTSSAEESTAGSASQTFNLQISDLPDFLRWPVTSVANASGLDVPSSTMLVLSHVAGWAGFGAGTQTVDEHWVSGAFNQLVALPNSLVQSRVTTVLVDELGRLEEALRKHIRSPPEKSIRMSAEELFRKPVAEEPGGLTFLRDPDAVTLRVARGNAHRDCLLVAVTNDQVIRTCLESRSQRADRELLGELLEIMGHSDRRPVRSGKPSAEPETISGLRANVLFQTTPQTLRRALAVQHPLVDQLLRESVHWQAVLREEPAKRLPWPSRIMRREEWARVQRAATGFRRSDRAAFAQTRESIDHFTGWESLVMSSVSNWSERIQWRLAWVLDLPYQLYTALQIGCENREGNAGACANMAVELATWVTRNALQLHRKHENESQVLEAESHEDRLYRKIAAKGPVNWRELLRSESVQRKDVHEEAINRLIGDGRIELCPDGRFVASPTPDPMEPEIERHATA